MKYLDAKKIFDKNPLFGLAEALDAGISKKQFDKWDKEIEEEGAAEVEDTAPDYIGFDKFISKYADKSTPEQMQGLAEGIEKFNLGKTEAKQLLGEKVKVVQAHLRDTAKKEKLAAAAKENDIKKQAKEMKRNQKKAEEDAAKMEKKLILEELEATWETCDDELFKTAIDIDWKQAKHYFMKRLMEENTHVVEEKRICGIKTFGDNKDIILYSVEDGIYAQEADVGLASEIEHRLGEKCSDMMVKEVLNSIRRRTTFDRETLQDNPKYLRPIGNGLWNIKERKLLPFTPKFVFLNKIAIDHIEGATCEKFKAFLRQVLETEKEFLVCQEWIGYCLLNDVRFAKALLLYGDGENGKSVLLNVIREFLGQKNVTSISLQYLEHSPFAPSRFFGKAANIFADLPKKALSQTSVFKMAVAGDALTGEKKGKDSFEFIPFLKMMFSCNEPPRTPDRTRGFFRRWLILEFRQHFPEGDPRRDEGLFDKLKDAGEMQGILQFALEGLYRLIEQKGFTPHMSMADVEDFWLRHSDSVAAFHLDMIEKDSLSEELKSGVFDKYEAYCAAKGYQPEEPNNFWQRLKELFDVVEKRRNNNFGTQIRYISGIKIRFIDSVSSENDGGFD